MLTPLEHLKMTMIKIKGTNEKDFFKVLLVTRGTIYLNVGTVLHDKV